MSEIRRCWLVLGTLVLAGWGRPAGLAADSPVPRAEAKKREPRFTISKETTYVTGPVDPDGYIDYATALNERLRRGITPANNANVLIWKALGPRPEGAEVAPEIFKWLGIQPLPEHGDYIIDPFRYMKEHLKGDPGKQGEQVYEELTQLAGRPWTPKQHPHIAGWLKANEKPLALLVEATKRSQYFSPLIPPRRTEGRDILMHALLPSVQKCRELAVFLAARAMLRVGEGRYDDAWQNLQACHRLGRLVAEGGSGIEYLVGVAVDGIASDADLAFVESAKLNARQIKDRLHDLEKLPPLPPVADAVGLGERFVFLDNIMMFARHGPDFLEGRVPSKPPSAGVRAGLDYVDWDPALRDANRLFSRAAAILRLKDHALKDKRWGELEQEMTDMVRNGRGWGSLARALVTEGSYSRAQGKAIGDILLTLFLPALAKFGQAADRCEQVRRNVQVAFALAAYRSEHGHYPAALDALAPKYLAQVPGDLFSGKALRYYRTERGYLLYSVGVNGVDDQGRTEDDDPPGDDLTVRMPLPRLPQR